MEDTMPITNNWKLLSTSFFQFVKNSLFMMMKSLIIKRQCEFILVIVKISARLHISIYFFPSELLNIYRQLVDENVIKNKALWVCSHFKVRAWWRGKRVKEGIMNDHCNNLTCLEPPWGQPELPYAILALTSTFWLQVMLWTFMFRARSTFTSQIGFLTAASVNFIATQQLQYWLICDWELS